MNARSNNRITTLVILTLTALMMLGVGSALAQGPGAGNGQRCGRGSGDGEFGPGHRLELMAEKLELTEDQQAAIKGIHDLGQEKNRELRKELMRLHNELQGEMMKDEPSEKAALDLVGKIGDLRTEIQANRLSSRLEVREQLTPEQRDKMMLMHDRSQRGKNCRGGGRGMGSHGDGDCDGPHQGRGRRCARGF